MLTLYLSAIETEGDQNKFTQLYRLYENAMYHIAYSILHDRFLAEDAVHEAFIRLFKYLPDIVEVNCHKTKALIVIIVKSASIDIYRKRKKQFECETEIPEDTMELEELPLERIIADEAYQELMKEMKKLKKEYQEIILLKYVYELSNKEIGLFMSLSDSAVRQNICRAKKAVKKLIEENNH